MNYSDNGKTGNDRAVSYYLTAAEYDANEDGTAACKAEPSVESAQFIAKTGASVILMHSGAGTQQEVSDFLGQRTIFCISNGLVLFKFSALL